MARPVRSISLAATSMVVRTAQNVRANRITKSTIGASKPTPGVASLPAQLTPHASRATWER